MKEEGKYVNGKKKQGIWTGFNKDGSINWQREYDAGKKIDETWKAGKKL